MLLVERERDWIDGRSVWRKHACEAHVSFVEVLKVEPAIRMSRERRGDIVAGYLRLTSTQLDFGYSCQLSVASGPVPFLELAVRPRSQQLVSRQFSIIFPQHIHMYLRNRRS